MNRTTSIVYYLVGCFLTVIALISFVKLPSIIFVGMEDYVLSLLFFVFTVLGVLSFSLYIADFFLIKLGMYSIMSMERNNIYQRVERLEQQNKILKDELFEIKIKVKYSKERD